MDTCCSYDKYTIETVDAMCMLWLLTYVQDSVTLANNLRGSGYPAATEVIQDELIY